MSLWGLERSCIHFFQFAQKEAAFDRAKTPV